MNRKQQQKQQQSFLPFAVDIPYSLVSCIPVGNTLSIHFKKHYFNILRPLRTSVNSIYGVEMFTPQSTLSPTSQGIIWNTLSGMGWNSREKNFQVNFDWFVYFPVLSYSLHQNRHVQSTPQTTLKFCNNDIIVNWPLFPMHIIAKWLQCSIGIHINFNITTPLGEVPLQGTYQVPDKTRPPYCLVLPP